MYVVIIFIIYINLHSLYIHIAISIIYIHTFLYNQSKESAKQYYNDYELHMLSACQCEQIHSDVNKYTHVCVLTSEWICSRWQADNILHIYIKESLKNPTPSQNLHLKYISS